MRLCLGLIIVSLSLVPVLAEARSPVGTGPGYVIGAAIDGRDRSLVIAIASTAERAIEIPIRVRAATTRYDWLTVEFTSPTFTRTLAFAGDRERAAIEHVVIEPRGSVTERIPLDHLGSLPPGTYDVRVIWDGHQAMTTWHVPDGCALSPPPADIASPPPPAAPSKLPDTLGALLALLVAAAFAKRAGTPDGCVPCSTP